MNTAIKVKREMSSQAKIAGFCKKYLKSISVPCKVKSDSFAGGSSVAVYVTDLTPTAIASIKEEFNKYEIGHFDGMTDMYEYSNVRDDVPQTKFLTVNNKFSQELKQRVWTFLKGHCADAESLPEIYTDVPTNTQVFNMFASDLVYRTLTGSYTCISELFWEKEAGLCKT